MEGKISAVRTALQGEDMGQIDAAVTELQTAIQKVGQLVYSQSAPEEETPPAEGGDDEEPPEGTVEGEFERGVARLLSRLEPGGAVTDPRVTVPDVIPCMADSSRPLSPRLCSMSLAMLT